MSGVVGTGDGVLAASQRFPGSMFGFHVSVILRVIWTEEAGIAQEEMIATDSRDVCSSAEAAVDVLSKPGLLYVKHQSLMCSQVEWPFQNSEFILPAHSRRMTQESSMAAF